MLGVVLAGGEGRRMGRDKALLDFEGEPLWKRQARVLREAGASRVFINRRRDQAPLNYELVVYDTVADSGPLAGIAEALALGGDDCVAVLAVDMPGIDAGWFARLREAPGQGEGAVARSGEVLEPLAAIYPGGSAALAAARLARRELSVRGFALELAESGRMRILPVSEADAGRLASLNEPRV
jgi:molybdopterin-guanine dinucleotide biosynthesis protein A